MVTETNVDPLVPSTHGSPEQPMGGAVRPDRLARILLHHSYRPVAGREARSGASSRRRQGGVGQRVCSLARIQRQLPVSFSKDLHYHFNTTGGLQYSLISVNQSRSNLLEKVSCFSTQTHCCSLTAHCSQKLNKNA